MNTYNAQNPSEMLHLLFDGELDSSMETPLYASLMQNEDLRSELRELIAIRESIRGDVEAFTPPVAATHGIFSKLGYNAPIPTKRIPNVPVGFMGLMKQKLWNPVTSAVLASLITTLLFLNFYGNNESNDVSNQLASGVKNKISNSGIVPNVIIGQEKQIGNVNNNIPKKSNVIYRDRIKYVYLNKEEVKAENEITQTVISPESEKLDNSSMESITEDSKSWLSMVSPASLFQIDNGSLNPFQMLSKKTSEREFVLANNFYPKTGRSYSLMLQLKGMSVTSFPNVEFVDATGGMLKNFSFGAYVPISENIHFGIEGGQEPFSQVFYHIENNQLYRIEQNPVLQWAGFGVKFNMEEQIKYLANAQPFLNLTLASTRVGPYGKMIAGLQFLSDNGLGVMIGLEAGSLLYQEQTRFYSTEKFGFTYGMFVKF